MFACRHTESDSPISNNYPEFNRCFFSTSTGHVRLQNTFLGELECDTLYHLGLDNKNHDLVRMFGDVRFVIMGGSSRRMEKVNFCFCQFKILSIDYKSLQVILISKYFEVRILHQGPAENRTANRLRTGGHHGEEQSIFDLQSWTSSVGFGKHLVGSAHSFEIITQNLNKISDGTFREHVQRQFQLTINLSQ